MEKTFVAVNDWCHKLLRDLARRTPLAAVNLDNGLDRVLYQVRPELLPENYFSLVACHTLDGLPLEQLRLGCWRVREGCKSSVLKTVGGFDATRLDRRCWGDLRLKPPGGQTALVSGELLVFGTGMLRAGGLGGRHGAIGTRRHTVFTRIWALRREGPPALPRIQKSVYESTNLIYGDALGELEQLWERRADTAFLEKVAEVLSDVPTWGQSPLSAHSPLNAGAVLRLHRRAQAIWNAPPRTARALLRRLEFILEHTTVEDCSPKILVPRMFPGAGNAAAPGSVWRRDNSGYDGWLPGNAALN